MEKTMQAKIGGYTSTLLRSSFGKGPTSVYVTIAPPYITIHFRGFLTPMEMVLLKQNKIKRILETRDLLMNDLRPQIIQELKEIGEFDVKELYADWDLKKETGLIIAVIGENEKTNLKWPTDVNRQAFIEKLIQASIKAEKQPGKTEAFWLDNRTLLVKRTNVLVEIEKELIRNGYSEELRISKRPLEHRMLKEVQLEEVLNRPILETFLAWNFEMDIAYLVFLMNPTKT